MTTDASPINGVVQLVDGVIRDGVRRSATDIHFEPNDAGLLIRYRIDGVLVDGDVLPAALAPNVLARLKVLAGLLTYRVDLPQEGAVSEAAASFGCEIRVATFPTVRGERAALRLLANASRFLSLEQLGHRAELIAAIQARLAQPQGLMLVCGPAGSGKTTTLFAMLDYLLRTRPGVSVISVEDPVEIRLSGVTQIELAPLRGLTYPVALRSLLRQDPQVLMIGEIRDAEVARIVIEAALTGHLLLSSMHSGSAAEALLRLREMGVPPYQVTSTVTGILSQRLVRRQSPDGAGAAAPAGTSGRAPIGHWTEMTPALRAAITSNADTSDLEAIIQAGPARPR